MTVRRRAFPSSAAWLAVALAPSALAQVTVRVSVDSAGVQGSGHAGTYRPSMSPDGRHVAFEASRLGNGATPFLQVYVRDRQTGTTERVSVDSSEVEGDFDSFDASITPDARFVAFESLATNLVPADTGDHRDVFVRDRTLGTTERASVDSSGAQGDGSSLFPSISDDGRWVAFESLAANLVPGDTNGLKDVFVRDRQAGTTERVNLGPGGVQANGDSDRASISPDGRYVVFTSYATTLVPGHAGNVRDVFLLDRQSGAIECVSVDAAGNPGNFNSYEPTISPDARFVAFHSHATSFVAGDTNTTLDVFVRDRLNGTIERVSVGTGGTQGNGQSQSPSISADGRYVAYFSWASNLVPGDTNGFWEVFVRDRLLGTTERSAVDSAGAQGNLSSEFPSISADGRCVAFSSYSTNLVLGDTNDEHDVFLRDRTGGTSFASLCDPGIGGVIACPCANPPSGPGRGCDNSSGTGGATLAASGSTSLSSDSLVLATSGEKPTALSIVAQWNGASASGLVFGMGVRCTSGTLKRLYTKTASGGSIVAPSFAAGDPPVAARSAALGDPILAGQSRWYLVYYRDPIVLGGCPATSTFDATQTGRVSWSP